MHVLFVHRNFPAQFGHIARHLITEKGWRCSFVSETDPGNVSGIRKIQYKVSGGATKATHFCSRTFENGVWHASAVYDSVRTLRDELSPDLIVGHSGFGSTLFLPELWPGIPVISYFEYFYRPHGSDIDFRTEWPVPTENFLRSRARNAMILLDLEYCTAGYSPTRWQHSLLPQGYADKIRVIHDGIDTSVWHRRADVPRHASLPSLHPETRLITYVSRGFESMRGFDVFMRSAKRIYSEYPNVKFLVVGSDRVCYGGDLAHIKEKSFREHVLKQDTYDMDKFIFPGRVPPEQLAALLSASDLHVYLTVPFVLSWSMLNAMACGCVVLGSSTPPVEEFIQEGKTGLLAAFSDVDTIAAKALAVLRDPDAFRPLGDAAVELIQTRYSLATVLPEIVTFYESTAGKQR